MSSARVQELRTKSDAAWASLTGQLEGLEPYMERSDAVGEWTTRQVLAHLLFEPGWSVVEYLKKFAEIELPPSEIIPGVFTMTDERRGMTLRQFTETLDAQRRSVFAYIEGLPEADLQRRKSRIPFLKPFAGTDEIPVAMLVGALFDGHWRDHAGQLAKIRKAVGLPEAK